MLVSSSIEVSMRTMTTGLCHVRVVTASSSTCWSRDHDEWSATMLHHLTSTQSKRFYFDTGFQERDLFSTGKKGSSLTSPGPLFQPPPGAIERPATPAVLQTQTFEAVSSGDRLA